MSVRYECDGCGLASEDLPDLVDPDLFFEVVDGKVLCNGCQQLPAHQRPAAWAGL